MSTNWSRSYKLHLGLFWLLVTVWLIVMLANGVRQTDAHDGTRRLMQVFYVSALLGYLLRGGGPSRELPELPLLLLRRHAAGRWIPVIIVALLFILTLISPDGSDIVMLLSMVATLGVLVARFREIRLLWFLQGLALGALAFLAALPFRRHGFITSQAHILLSGIVPFMYLAGSILVRRSGFGEVQLAAGRYGKALTSFLRGCLLFLPLGLLNAADGSPGGNVEWVDRFWLPPWTPFFSGIAEEALWRLFLVSLCYMMLRPAFRDKPQVAAFGAMLFSAVVFGLGHGYSFDAFLVTGLLYGLPMAAAFTQRDWEHAVGGHYIVNMIPMLVVYVGA